MIDSFHLPRLIIAAGLLASCSGHEERASIASRQQAVDWQAKHTLTANENDDGFGTDVAIDGNFVAAVAPTSSQGVLARVYEWTGTDFNPPAELPSSAGSSGASGASIALRGDQLIVGIPDASPIAASSGIAHVYVRAGATWSPSGDLIPNEAAEFAHFGTSVAIDGNTAAVGAPDQSAGSQYQVGSVFVFVNNGSGWTEQTQLLAQNGKYGDSFGIEISLLGDVLAVGARTSEKGTMSGSVFLYRRSGTTWSLEKQLMPTSFDAYAYFGSSAVALAPGLLVVGSSGASGTGSSSGLVYLFDPNDWSQITTLSASDAAIGTHFGTSVAVAGNHILAGAESPGAAYLFERANNVWSQTQRFTGDSTPSKFGLEVDLTDSAAIVGAANLNSTDPGHAFVFGMPAASGGSGGTNPSGGGAPGTGASGGGGGASGGGASGGSAGTTPKSEASSSEQSLYSCQTSVPASGDRFGGLAWLVAVCGVGLRFRSGRQRDRFRSRPGRRSAQR